SSSSGSISGSDSVMYPGDSAVGDTAAGIGCSSAGSTSSAGGRYSGYSGPEKDMIKTDKSEQKRTKPDKNEKRDEARKSLKQLQLKEEEKPKKTKKEWPKMHTRIKSYSTLKERRKEKGQMCKSSKVQLQGPILPTASKM
nr:hypothetical protein [Tanacetum cinerariifolium]